MLIAGALVTPFLHGSRARRGATSEEIERSYPGDDITTARGGTVHVLRQVGCNRDFGVLHCASGLIGLT